MKYVIFGIYDTDKYILEASDGTCLAYGSIDAVIAAAKLLTSSWRFASRSEQARRDVQMYEDAINFKRIDEILEST